MTDMQKVKHPVSKNESRASGAQTLALSEHLIQAQKFLHRQFLRI
jgi:hypothetical protein